MLKVSKLVAAAAVALLGLMSAACSKVPAGNVGVKYYLLGGDKGVDSEELRPGRYWIGVNEELYLFPTFTQTYVWTKEPVDGDNTDESITFQTVEGLPVNADIGISYSVDPTKVTTLFEKYKKGINEITDLYLRNMVRDALVTAGSSRPIESVYGAGKAELIEAVAASVRKEVDPIGIRIEKLYWAGDLRLPQNVTASINAKVQATQFAQQRQNEVAAAKAEADKQVEAARGEAEALRLAAEARASAIEMEGKALSNNPKVLELRAIERWQGQVPQVSGGSGAVPFINIPLNK